MESVIDLRGIRIGQHFGARGYLVSTVGRDEVIGEYIRQQEEEDKWLDQMQLWR